MKITFLGSGAWATALAFDLSQNGHEITLYGVNEAEVNDINLNHRNSNYFDDVVLPSSIKASSDPALALKEPDYLVLAVPSQAIRDVVGLVAKHCKSNPTLVNVIKGFDPNTGEGISHLIKKELGNGLVKGLVSLVGPSFAFDVIHKDLTAVCAVSEDKTLAKDVQKLFSTAFFRVYVQSDVSGAEIGAGMKNIIAIASGIMEGLGYKDNTRAALITRGLAEMTRYGVNNGAKADTFLGLTGVGDLTLTASSHRSRNYELGYEIGKANEAKGPLSRCVKTVEGVIAAKTIHRSALEKGISVPIVDAVYSVLYEDAKPSEMVISLMKRDLKEE